MNEFCRNCTNFRGDHLMHFLSCIIIAKNQVSTLIRCIDSVRTALHSSDIRNAEIIYVDSASSDGSANQVISTFGQSVAVYCLSGAMNAAIARNKGALCAKGDVFCFVDGDMEIDKEWFGHAYSDREGLRYDAVSGKLFRFARTGQRVVGKTDCSEIVKTLRLLPPVEEVQDR